MKTNSLCELIISHIFIIISCNSSAVSSLKILQIVPGFTNSHVLFNYRLSDTLTKLGHEVSLWTQMEMSMVFTGDFSLPSQVAELRIPIHFTDSLKTEGLKVFQSMMFNEGTPYDLWWTGQEFKDMRVESFVQMLSIDENKLSQFKDENFDLVVGHFHDLCPVALARKVDVDRLVWITHGTSLYDFTAVQMGLRTFPSFVPHPLSACGDHMDFRGRLVNLLWHLSTLDFVNLPENLLSQENEVYKQKFAKENDPDLWQLSQRVDVLLINGERFLDFPRPLPMGIAFMGEVGKKQLDAGTLPVRIKQIFEKANKGVVIFSLGTVSNTTNMPDHMASCFVQAFSRFPDYEFVWKTEIMVMEAEKYTNIHLLRWLPQKELMANQKSKLLIAHGGYNSFLEAAQAGIPIVLMPLFADQFINAERAQRFGVVEVLDKLALSADKIADAIHKTLHEPKYSQNAVKLASMLQDKPSQEPHAVLKYSLKLAKMPRNHFALKAAQKLSQFQFYNYDIVGYFVFLLC